jgi:putative colanic acid biosynthesis acetyltransferase WcaF
MFGAKIGANVHVHPSVKISVPWNLQIDDQAAVGDGAILYSLGLIHIGKRATISQYAHLCAGSHDYSRASFDLLKPPISIGEDVWICADAFIGPGVSVGAATIVGARAVVTKDLPHSVIAVGNPMRIVRSRPAISS